MVIDSTVVRELVLKQHNFRSELSEADVLFCVTQFAVLAATGFPLVAGMDVVPVEDHERGICVVFPDWEILSKVTHEDMRDVEKRYLTNNLGWGSATCERGQFYVRGGGRAFKLKLLYK